VKSSLGVTSIRGTDVREFSASDALEFVETVELPTPPRSEADLEAAAAFDFDKAKSQALVVGSDIVSFVKGVTEERRLDIVNSALLAQLVAKKRVPNATQIFPWYDAYFDALSNIGWVIQDREFSEHKETSADFQAHEAILTIAASLLGPNVAALQVIKATLNALKQMRDNSPFIRLFNRESQYAKTARFQIMLAEQAESAQFLVTLMAFGLVAEATFTQVLFFKFRSNAVELKHSSGKVTINPTVLESVRDAMKRKLAAYAKDYVAKLPDL
jgi:hypothetical protein